MKTSTTIAEGWALNGALPNDSATNDSLSNGSVTNGPALIHFLHYSDPSKPATIPLIVIPGMVQSAEDVAATMRLHYANPTICISFRGRGNSESPSLGYTFEDHVGDIAAVVDHLKLQEVGILGISTGTAFAIGYTARHHAEVCYMILHDYPPIYPALTQAWGEEVRRMANNRISSYALPRIITESRETVLVPALAEIHCPALVTRGGDHGSLLNEAIAALYTRHLPDCQLEVLSGVGHDPFSPSSLLFEVVVRGFTSMVENHAIENNTVENRVIAVF